MALPRSRRLRSSGEIREVSRTGARARVGDLLVSVAPGTSATVGCVVFGRRAGGAVVRNRLRRRVQHELAPVLETVPVGTRVVVRGGPGVADLDAAALRAAVASGVARAVRRAEQTP